MFWSAVCLGWEFAPFILLCFIISSLNSYWENALTKLRRITFFSFSIFSSWWKTLPFLSHLFFFSLLAIICLQSYHVISRYSVGFGTAGEFLAFSSWSLGILSHCFLLWAIMSSVLCGQRSCTLGELHPWVVFGSIWILLSALRIMLSVLYQGSL